MGGVLDARLKRTFWIFASWSVADTTRNARIGIRSRLNDGRRLA
jgi:hypothetical protein